MIKKQARRIQLGFIFESIDDVTYEVMVLEDGWVTGSNKISHVQLVHAAGHSSLRPKPDEAAGVIFVIDFLGLLPTCRSAAEYLYDILSKASVVKKRITVLIVCNKTEKSAAYPKGFIGKQLEKEIEVRFDVIAATRVTFYPH
jgi:signal recognition particle receptor beta subunit